MLIDKRYVKTMSGLEVKTGIPNNMSILYKQLLTKFKTYFEKSMSGLFIHPMVEVIKILYKLYKTVKSLWRSILTERRLLQTVHQTAPFCMAIIPYLLG